MQFEISADAKVLETVLAEAKVGDLITYAALSKAIGRDVRQHALGALNTARKRLLKEKKIVFGVEVNEGMRRLNDSQIVASTESDRLRLQRTAKRSLCKLASVTYAELSSEDKKAHTTAAAQMGTIAMFTQASSTKKIASQVENRDNLPIGDTLKLFV